jgi:transcriptional regulator
VRSDRLPLDNRQEEAYGVDCLEEADDGAGTGREREPADERRVSKPNVDLLQGTLDLLVLRTLAPGPMHGWGIAQRIQDVSEDVLRVNQGSLYPALYRLEEEGWIESEWGASEKNRRAKFYRLTKSGQKRLNEERESWERLSGAVTRILQTA